MTRSGQWLPTRVDARVRVFAWLSFLAEVLIIGTGGAVRLTGSGLGCPTWPTCTPESLVPTPEMGIHGVIEFGNRTLTGLVGILAVIVLVLVWRLRRERRVLFALAVIVVLGVVAQAIVGGVTVWTGLNPVIVGFHYVASVALVCVTAAFIVLMDQPAGTRRRVVPGVVAGLAHLTSAALAVTIAVGVVTTASGPHSGDANAGRTGFNAEILAHVHAWPGYVLLVLTLALLIAVGRNPGALRRWVVVLLGVEAVQIAVGVYQAREGLPPLAVGVHMVLAALTAATMTAVLLSLKQPVEADDRSRVGSPAASVGA